jgi:hypothetical protein
MGRKTKNNADYFSHDNDMRNDEKIRAVRRAFGHAGYSVWNMLLEKLCKASDFTLKYSDGNVELWSGDFEVDPDQLGKIIDYFLKVGLIVHLDGMIFSVNMIERFSGLLDKRNRSKERFLSQKSTINSISDGRSTQSKVKYSKVKKSKEVKEETSSPAFLRFVELCKNDCPNVLKMKEPLTEDQLSKLIKDHGKDKVVETLKDMHNWKPLLTKNISAKATCEKWIKRDKAKNTVNPVKTINSVEEHKALFER